MKLDRSLRGARAAVFAVACVGVSAAGHTWMSGSAVPVWALAVALLATGIAGYAAAGRRRGFGPIAGLMLGGELGLHMLFSAAQQAAGGTAPTMPAMPGMAAMPGMPGMQMPSGVPGASGAGSMAWMTAHGSAGMIAVHAAAGLLSAWWLWRGEAAVFRLLGVLAHYALPRLVPARPHAPALAEHTRATPADRGGHAPVGCPLLAHVVVRRGPPPCVLSGM
jgi:hypothetical protein